MMAHANALQLLKGLARDHGLDVAIASQAPTSIHSNDFFAAGCYAMMATHVFQY